MARIRKKNTKPEIRVRRLLHEMGYRFRLHASDLPGTPDIVFRSKRLVIFAHGCFWHQHGCKLTRRPKTNLAHWLPKLERNIARDRAAQVRLKALGWRVLTVWECEVDLPSLRPKLTNFLKAANYFSK